MFFEEGGLNLHVGMQDFAFAACDVGEAAAVDDGEIFADEIAIFVCCQGDNLEAELVGDEEDRVEDMVARCLAEGVVGDDDAVVEFRVRDAGVLFGEVVEAAENKRDDLAADLGA